MDCHFFPFSYHFFSAFFAPSISNFMAEPVGSKEISLYGLHTSKRSRPHWHMYCSYLVYCGLQCRLVSRGIRRDPELKYKSRAKTQNFIGQNRHDLSPALSCTPRGAGLRSSSHLPAPPTVGTRGGRQGERWEGILDLISWEGKSDQGLALKTIITASWVESSSQRFDSETPAFWGLCERQKIS
jgi:hypothetical protein